MPARVLCLMVAALAASPAIARNDPPAPPAQSPVDPMTSAQIGAMVRDQLSPLAALSFEQRVTYGHTEYVILRRMAPDAFRSEVYSQGRLLFAIAMSKGRITEFLAKDAPGSEGPAPTDLWITYAAPALDGVSTTQLGGPELDSAIGSCLATWIGPAASRPADFARMIAQCQTFERTMVDDRLCYHASRADTVPDDGSGKPRSYANHYYVDVQTGRLLRWDSTQFNPSREEPVRRRCFSNFSTKPIPDSFVWTLTPENLQRTLVSEAQPSKTASREAASEGGNQALGGPKTGRPDRDPAPALEPLPRRV